MRAGRQRACVEGDEPPTLAKHGFAGVTWPRTVSSSTFVGRESARRPQMASFLTGNNVNLSSSLYAWLNLPKRMMARMQLYGHDTLFNTGINHSVAPDDVLVEHQFTRQLERDTRTLAGLPSSFSFVTSSYALGLFITGYSTWPYLVPDHHTRISPAIVVHLSASSGLSSSPPTSPPHLSAFVSVFRLHIYYCALSP
jgi:hypothetical protein